MIGSKRLAAVASLLLIGAGEPRPVDLPGDRLFPESVATAPGGLAYVSSMSGGVLRIHLATGRVEQWIKPGAFGTGALFGVFADTRNRLLWTCTNDFTAQGLTVAGSDSGAWAKASTFAPVRAASASSSRASTRPATISPSRPTDRCSSPIRAIPASSAGALELRSWRSGRRTRCSMRPRAAAGWTALP